MIYKKIQLDENDKNVFLEIYIADPIGDFVRDAILIIPGGAYGEVCHEREGEPIALAFIPHGYNAFVLHYSVNGGDLSKGTTFPLQLIQASKAIKHIKDNAEEYNINPERVFAAGFSAGGHLAGSLGILWNNKEVYDAVHMEYGYNRPKGIMMIYPVVSNENEFMHLGTFKNLLCVEDPRGEISDKVSLEKHVSEESSPAFIMATSNDEIVDVRHSLRLAEAYKTVGKMFELHIYPEGPHGVALGNEVTRCGNDKWVDVAIAGWIEQAVYWAKKIK